MTVLKNRRQRFGGRADYVAFVHDEGVSYFGGPGRKKSVRLSILAKQQG